MLEFRLMLTASKNKDTDTFRNKKKKRIDPFSNSKVF
jgi:hypothetical protein